MKVSRRKILAGLSASALVRPRPALAWRHGKQTGIQNYVQGALGGGGFAFQLSSSPDGSIRFMRGDTPNLYRWDSGSGLFKNISTSPYMDGIGIAVQGFDRAYAVACAADNQRVYMITGVMPPRLGYINTGGGQIGMDHGQCYRSDDKGNTWIKPGSANPATDPLRTPLSAGANGHFYQGPFLTVDPNNKDVAYFLGWNGAVWVTRDGGANWTLLISLMRSALPRGFATADTTVGLNTITMGGGCPISGATAGIYSAFNATHPFAFGGSNGDDVYGVPGATSFVVGAVQKNDGTQAFYGDAAVVSGDEIFFGRGGGVIVDGSGGTTTVGGVTVSNIVYFAWMAGATSPWMSTDGAQTFSAMTGGPVSMGGKMKLSTDAAIAPTGGNNVLYMGASSGTNPYWRWVKTPPTGSGLAANTWTNLPVNPSDGSVTMCPDPLQKGKVCYLTIRGHTYYSTDYGTTTSGAWGSGYINAYTQAPWLASDDWEMSDGEFDPVVSNKLWISDGIGVLTNFPFNNANQPTMAFAGQALQSLIVGGVLKVPAPGNVIVLGQCQDRPIIVCADVNTVPDGYFPGVGVGNSGGYPCYSLNDPTKIFAPNGSDIVQYAFTSGGGVQNWNPITATGVNGWPSSQPASTGMLASKTSSQLCAILNGVNILYGTRSGSTWSWVNSTYLGNPVVGEGSFPIGKSRGTSIDNVNGTIYFYRYGTRTLYISTDGGATFTSPGGVGGGPTSGGVGCRATAAHGVPNHFFITNGYDGGGAQNPPNANLFFTNNGGASWSTVLGDYIISACVCPTKPGSSYPTIYVLGRLSGNPTYKISVYRCTDFNPSTGAGTWVDIGANLAKVNCEGFQGGLWEDPEVWSTFYLATNDTGYLKSFIT